ncbi:hypothetical protein ACFLQV_04125 [Calditrichota bacterium]
MDISTLQQRLVDLCDDGIWQSSTRLLSSITFPDRNCFFTLNILLTLDQCNGLSSELIPSVAKARRMLAEYNHKSLTCFWEVRDAQPTYFGSKLLGRLVKMSADPDSTCLDLLAVPDETRNEAVLEALATHRIDGDNFRLVKMLSKHLLDAHGTFLSWFPAGSTDNLPQQELVDVVVDVNILWYVKSLNRLDIAGCNETIRFVRSAITSELVLTDPFLVSPYYPFPAVVIFMLVRAIVWGGIVELEDLLPKLISFASKVTPTRNVDRLLLLATAVMTDNDQLIDKYRDALNSTSRKPDTIFVGSVTSVWAAINYNLARVPIVQAQFSCEAFSLALKLWIMQQLTE